MTKADRLNSYLFFAAAVTIGLAMALHVAPSTQPEQAPVSVVSEVPPPKTTKRAENYSFTGAYVPGQFIGTRLGWHDLLVDQR